MALKLSQLSRARRNCTVTVTLDADADPVETGELAVQYNPRAITPDFEARAIEVDTTNKGHMGFLADALSSFLLGWDLEDEEGNPVPTDAETLKSMKAAFLAEVFQGIMRDLAPNQTTAEDSGGS